MGDATVFSQYITNTVWGRIAGVSKCVSCGPNSTI